jgi:tetratricopeptide (TPR) repeat protein
MLGTAYISTRTVGAGARFATAALVLLLLLLSRASADGGPLTDGNSELDAGKFEAAIEDFDKVLSDNPSSLKAHEGLAWAYYGSRDFAKAAEEADRRLALAPDDRGWHADWATIVRDAPGREEEALSTVRRWADEAPSDQAAQVLLGRMLGDTGDLVGARRLLNALLASAPDNVDALRALAAIERFDQHYPDARALLKRAAALQPHDEGLQRELADATRDAKAFRAAQAQPTITLSLAVILFGVVAGQASRTAARMRAYLLAGTTALVAAALGWLYFVPLG